MRCKYCGKTNERKAVFCRECGNRLSTKSAPSFFKAFSVISTAVFVCLLLLALGTIGLIAAGTLSNIRRDPNDETESKNQASNNEPLNIETENQTVPPVREVIQSSSEDLIPIIKMISFIESGESDDLMSALPEGSIDMLLGEISENARYFPQEIAIPLLREVIVIKLKNEYGDFESIGFAFKSRSQLSDYEIRGLKTRLSEMGIIRDIDEARSITIELDLLKKQSVIMKEMDITVLRFGSEWKLDPSGI